MSKKASLLDAFSMLFDIDKMNIEQPDEDEEILELLDIINVVTNDVSETISKEDFIRLRNVEINILMCGDNFIDKIYKTYQRLACSSECGFCLGLCHKLEKSFRFIIDDGIAWKLFVRFGYIKLTFKQYQYLSDKKLGKHI